jgi:hypothetical protein
MPGTTRTHTHTRTTRVGTASAACRAVPAQHVQNVTAGLSTQPPAFVGLCPFTARMAGEGNFRGASLARLDPKPHNALE